jgi:hypothetical protein
MTTIGSRRASRMLDGLEPCKLTMPEAERANLLRAQMQGRAEPIGHSADHG